MIRTKPRHVKALPSLERLKEVLRYDPETGILTWIAPTCLRASAKRFVGRVAGKVGRDGYRYLMLDSQNYSAHRIAWKLSSGCDPVNEIDHRDGDRVNNKWINLREATHGENNHNLKCKSHSSTGLKGVSFYPNKPGEKKWKASIRKNNNQYHLGYFLHKEEAAAAYRDAALRLYAGMARCA